MEPKIYLTAEVFGMCGGVFAALKTLEELVVSSSGQRLYVFRELVHNRFVTTGFEKQAVVFTENIEEIPHGVTLVIGAHGVSPDVEASLRSRAAICKDVTCPLVKKLHRIVSGLTPDDQLIIFGKAEHPEVQGVIGYSGTPQIHIISSPQEAQTLPHLSHPVFISQTTVAYEDVEETLCILKKRYPTLRVSAGICDASGKRQAAVVKLAQNVDAVLVIGSPHSSNAEQLREIAERSGVAAFLIDSAAELTAQMLEYSRIGITSGASTPQFLFDEVITALEVQGFVNGKTL